MLAIGGGAAWYANYTDEIQSTALATPYRQSVLSEDSANDSPQPGVDARQLSEAATGDVSTRSTHEPEANATVLASAAYEKPVIDRAEHEAAPNRVADKPQSKQSSQRRLFESVRFLASDELEGRGRGTKGLEIAAQYLGKEFEAIGLKTDLYSGTPFQVFERKGKWALGESNAASFTSENAQSIPLRLGHDFTPLSLSRSAALDFPLVFVGYGITAPEWNYDDYAGVDVARKAVIVLRHEPQRGKEGSRFNGTQDSEYVYLYRKLQNAVQHKAAAIVLCTDQFEIEQRLQQQLQAWNQSLAGLRRIDEDFRQLTDPTIEQIEAHRQAVQSLAKLLDKRSDELSEDYDPLLGFKVDSRATQENLPILHCRREYVNRLLTQATGKTLGQWEQEIDRTGRPQSCGLPDWKLKGNVSLHWEGRDLKNVLAVLEGAGPLAEETVVIGAHYDHLGWGGWGSLSMNFNDEIHNGADDNASGTAVLLEIARNLAAREKPLPRRVLFIAFTAEESGLIGSSYYVSRPFIPLDQTIAMLNLDMVGRLREERMTVFGTGTAASFSALIDRFGQEHGFDIRKSPGGAGPSDHASFYSQGIPVLHFFTGFHPDYHTPGDDYHKLNIEGMHRVAELVTDLAVEIASAPERPQPITGSKKEFAAIPWLLAGPPKQQQNGTSYNKPSTGPGQPLLGVRGTTVKEGKGYRVTTLLDRGPAKKAGIRIGDVIRQLGDDAIEKSADLPEAVKKCRPNQTIDIRFERNGIEYAVKVTLGEA